MIDGLLAFERKLGGFIKKVYDFFGGGITAEKLEKWCRVKYDSNRNCVMMALVLGVAKNKGVMTKVETNKKIKDNGISKKKDIPILAAGKQIWQKRSPNKAKSSKSGCRMSAKRNPFQRRFKIDKVGVNLTVIWGMSV